MVPAAPLDFERPHGGVDADLSIGDVEEAGSPHVVFQLFLQIQ